MQMSRDRILTTHVGSLPRNDTLSDLLVKREAGEPYDKAGMNEEMDRAVAHVVDKQASAGIDIGNDGEQQRVGFQTYVPQRMSGFGGVSKRRRGREFEEFPALMENLKRRFPHHFLRDFALTPSVLSAATAARTPNIVQRVQGTVAVLQALL